jgi:hypothetical protein
MSCFLRVVVFVCVFCYYVSDRLLNFYVLLIVVTSSQCEPHTIIFEHQLNMLTFGYNINKS